METSFYLIIKEKTISLRLKKILTHLLVVFLKSLILFQKAITFLWTHLIVKIINFIGKIIFRFFIVRLYKIYLLVKTQIIAIYRPAKGKFFYPFSTRYIIHIFIILLTIIVTTNNLSAKEINEEVGSKSLIGSLFHDEQYDMIVETSETNKETTIGYIESTGSVVGKPIIEEGEEPDDSTAMTKEGAIVKPNLVATTIGDRPRDKVTYHEVQEGETVSEIADQYSLSTNTILWENNLGPRDFIKPGQKLTILPASGVSYQIKNRDNLESIAKKYGVEVNSIVDYNNLASAEAIVIDQILLIPGGVPPEPPAPVVQPRSRFASLRNFFSASAPDDATPNYGTKLQWPTVSRKINQYYRWRHTGIDIDGNNGTPIYASDTGRVEEAGWSGGYGLQVTINHGNGLKTLYGHFSKINVRVGDSVSRGQAIGSMGCTGWCTGPHVHFEVYVGGRRVNPLSYL